MPTLNIRPYVMSGTLKLKEPLCMHPQASCRGKAPMSTPSFARPSVLGSKKRRLNISLTLRL